MTRGDRGERPAAFDRRADPPILGCAHECWNPYEYVGNMSPLRHQVGVGGFAGMWSMSPAATACLSPPVMSAPRLPERSTISPSTSTVPAPLLTNATSMMPSWISGMPSVSR